MRDFFEKVFGFFFWGAIVLYFFGAFDSEPAPTPKPFVPATQTATITPQAPAQQQYNRKPTPPSTFNGYDCTVDCSGHEAGYDWAEENGITDPDDCGGNSNSFIEGCESYAEEQESEEEDYDDEYEYDRY